MTQYDEKIEEIMSKIAHLVGEERATEIRQICYTIPCGDYEKMNRLHFALTLTEHELGYEMTRKVLEQIFTKNIDTQAIRIIDRL